MEGLREWALAVCAAAVAGSLAHLACPSGEVAKVYKITISVFLLCCILAPVLTGALGGDWGAESFMTSETEEKTAELENTFKTQVKDEFCASIKAFVENELGLVGVSAQEISINVNTNEQGGIFITELIVFLSTEHEDKQAEIIAKLRDNLGIEPVIQFRQEVQG